MDEATVKKIKALSIALMLILICIILKKIVGSRITSVQDYRNLMKSFGWAGPIALTLFQAFQVVVPIVPGYLGCAAGAVTYGTFIGFLCNYIGICTGSVIAFLLARHYGVGLVTAMFSEKQYLKWKEKIKGKKSYDAFLFVATLLPLFPDDFLCYFSGLMEMSVTRFVWIIILGKPWCILFYSIIFGNIG